MTFTNEQTVFFTNLIEQWFQNKYGYNWKSYFHKNMTPSPIKEWAQLYNVSIIDINNLRFNLTFKYSCEGF
jgi:hypothetical protein